MNYFISNFFRDWKWWAKLGFVSVATMNMFDIISQGRFFNLWIVRGTIIAGFASLLAYFIYQNQRDKKRRQIETLLPAFIAERRAYFEKMTAVDPKFQTFCFDCRHYDAGRTCCSLQLYDRESKIKLQPLDVFSYCLYWNLSDHPIMDLTESLFPPNEEN
jgi:hypothetical protein